MRLPQDRILHIDTEVKDGKVSITAEWQGELVRCNECKYNSYCLQRVDNQRHYETAVAYWTDKIEWCSRGERKGGEDE